MVVWLWWFRNVRLPLSWGLNTKKLWGRERGGGGQEAGEAVRSEFWCNSFCRSKSAPSVCLHMCVCVRAVPNNLKLIHNIDIWIWNPHSNAVQLFYCCFCYSACQCILFKPGISVWLVPLYQNIMWWQQKLNEVRTWKWTFVWFMDPMNTSHVKNKELKQKIAPSHVSFLSVCLVYVCSGFRLFCCCCFFGSYPHIYFLWNKYNFKLLQRMWRCLLNILLECMNSLF